MTKTAVLYNDTCPICSREIKHYDKIAHRDGLPVRFDALTQDAAGWNIAPPDAAKRIHVRHNGQIVDGMPAFVILWSQIPQYRWLSKLFSLPIIRPLSVLAYDHIAAPLLYGMHKRRQRRTVTQRNN